MPVPPNKRRAAFRSFACLCVAAAMMPLGASAQVVNHSKKVELTKQAEIEGIAVWYNVPPNSLAKRRAGKEELTAAHNRLPLGTQVRVTHLGNGKNVIVRITDRGIRKRRVLIDLCKEAAVKLDMVKEGSARVRLEILPEDNPAAKKSALRW